MRYSKLVMGALIGTFGAQMAVAVPTAEEAAQLGKTLTPVQMARVIETARAAGIHTVFVSPQFSSAQADAIARDIGGVTVQVDPLSKDYQNNLRRATEAFAGGMR